MSQFNLMGHLASGMLAGISHATTSPLANVIHTGISAAVNYQFQVMPPTLGEIIEARHRGTLTDDDVVRYAGLHGVPLLLNGAAARKDLSGKEQDVAKIWGKLYEASMHYPLPIETLTLWNREIISDEEADHYLTRNGYEDDRIKEVIGELRYEIPGPSDLVRFAIRHVFEPSLAARYGFTAEMPDDFVAWHKKQGFGKDISITDPTTGEKATINWAIAHWWAHWVWPAPSQAYTMFQQLRPGRHAQRFPEAREHPEFVDSDLNALLRGNDYPPYFRPYLAAINYRVIGLRQIVSLLETEVETREETVERYRDLGFPPRDSERLTQLAEAQIAGRMWKKYTPGIRNRVLHAFRTGTISRGEAGRLLYLLTLTTEDQASEFLALPEATQENAAEGSLGISLQLDSIEYEIVAKIADAGIAAAKREFLSGHMDESQTRSYLLGIGLTEDRVREQVRLFKSLFNRYRKELTTQQILGLQREGIVDGRLALQRLLNLGWLPPDAALLVLETDRKRAADLARQLEAKKKQEAAQADRRAALAAKRERDRVRAEKGHGSAAEMKRWLVAGYITPQQMAEQLKLDGVPEDRIELLVAEAIAAKDKKDAGKKKTPPAPP